MPAVRQDVVSMSIDMRSGRRQLLPNGDLESGNEETTAFLTEKGWLHRQFTAKDPDGTEHWERRLIVGDWMK